MSLHMQMRPQHISSFLVCGDICGSDECGLFVLKPAKMGPRLPSCHRLQLEQLIVNAGQLGVQCRVVVPLQLFPLDRHFGAVLPKFSIEGFSPDSDAAPVESSTYLLFEDAIRQDFSSVSVSRSHPIELPGFGTPEALIYLRRQGTASELIVGIHGPLTPATSTDPALRDFMNSRSRVPMLLVDGILVRRDLPVAAERLISEIQRSSCLCSHTRLKSYTTLTLTARSPSTRVHP